MLEGESGLTPILDRVLFDAYKNKSKITLPHSFNSDHDGAGLYETEFSLDINDDNPQPAGIVIPEAFNKANIYVNGYLMGKYWQEKGPQHKFFVPWGILNPKGLNHIAIAVWKREAKGSLGKVTIEGY